MTTHTVGVSLSTFLNGYFSFFFQLKSEAIQSSQFQGRLNEVIRTLTQVRRRISNPSVGKQIFPFVVFFLLMIQTVLHRKWGNLWSFMVSSRGNRESLRALHLLTNIHHLWKKRKLELLT